MKTNREWAKLFHRVKIAVTKRRMPRYGYRPVLWTPPNDHAGNAAANSLKNTARRTPDSDTENLTAPRGTEEDHGES